MLVTNFLTCKHADHKTVRRDTIGSNMSIMIHRSLLSNLQTNYLNVFVLGSRRFFSPRYKPSVTHVRCGFLYQIPGHTHRATASGLRTVLSSKIGFQMRVSRLHD